MTGQVYRCIRGDAAFYGSEWLVLGYYRDDLGTEPLQAELLCIAGRPVGKVGRMLLAMRGALWEYLHTIEVEA